jgi:hypothetical protein
MQPGELELQIKEQRAHVSLPWIMRYDLYPMKTLETEKQQIREIVGNEWMIVFGHDAGYTGILSSQTQ